MKVHEHQKVYIASFTDETLDLKTIANSAKETKMKAMNQQPFNSQVYDKILTFDLIFTGVNNEVGFK